MRARRTLYVPPKLDALRAWCEQQDTAPSFAASLRLAVTQCVWRGEGVQRERSSGGMTSYSRCMPAPSRPARLAFVILQAGQRDALASRLHRRLGSVGLFSKLNWRGRGRRQARRNSPVCVKLPERAPRAGVNTMLSCSASMLIQTNACRLDLIPRTPYRETRTKKKRDRSTPVCIRGAPDAQPSTRTAPRQTVRSLRATAWLPGGAALTTGAFGSPITQPPTARHVNQDGLRGHREPRPAADAGGAGDVC